MGPIARGPAPGGAFALAAAGPPGSSVGLAPEGRAEEDRIAAALANVGVGALAPGEASTYGPAAASDG